MKKLATTLIALAMLLSLSVSAFATESKIDADGGKGTANVTGTYQEAQTPDDVYSVEITWGTLSYTYVGESKQWSTSDLRWETNEAAHWEENANATIRVTNQSSVSIKATFSFEKNSEKLGNTEVGLTFEGQNGVTVTENAITVSSGSASNSATVLAKPTGSLPSTWTTGEKIGTITVTITKAG